MSSIRALADDVINKIAAGEVVERPSSVVRELIDNSLDSGATEIAVRIERGGQKLIEVRDNGSGIPLGEIELAFRRHATSKIAAFQDLERLETLGFRGEALASIASVSQISILTRPEGQELAGALALRAGQVTEREQRPAVRGTTLRIQNLFFNTPARRKFLKSERTEEVRIRREVVAAALAHPEVAFSYHVDGSETFRVPEGERSLARAKRFFSGELATVDQQLEGFSLQGLIGPPSLARSKAGPMYILVNGRLVNDRMIGRAVRESFGSMLKSREQPVGFLSLVLPSQQIDVNVHPQKTEVRFRNGNLIFPRVRAMTEEALVGLSRPKQESFRADPREVGRFDRSAWSPSLPLKHFTAVAEESLDFWSSAPGTSEGLPASVESETESGFRYSELRYLGQLFGCFLLCEREETFVIVDMHAAHERYNFNRLRNGFRSRDAVTNSQRLLLPITIELDGEQMVVISSQLELLEGFGFEFDEHSLAGEKLTVLAAPSVIPAEKISLLLQEVAENSFECSVDGTLSREIDHVAARLACHASIRSGDMLSREHVYALFELLDRSEFAAACPHGRPVTVAFTREEVERLFGRE